MRELAWDIPFEKPELSPSLKTEYSPLLSLVLALKGIDSISGSSSFLFPGVSSVSDPMLFTDMEKARERIRKAIAYRETVAIYGDYDVDGITSTCVFTDYLRSHGLRVIPYIPQRDEGYGLNNAAIDTLKRNGATLIITVDCGITAVAETAYAASLGIDMVITDHHECAQKLPDAVAVVDEKRPDDNYPFKALAGVGTALKVICACDDDPDGIIEKYADLVAVGTIADIMPLYGENRFYVQKGLDIINRSPRPGVAALVHEFQNTSSKINSTTIGYNIAPKLNATGRMERADIAVDLLLSGSPVTALEKVKKLFDLNRQRKDEETRIWNDAKGMLASHTENEPIILASKNWHPGVIGIVASRLSEEYCVPAIMIYIDDSGKGKGSCRSYADFNIYSAITACSDYLMGFGGHALAAGINIEESNIEPFRTAFCSYYSKNRTGTEPVVSNDLLIDSASLLTVDNVESLDVLEPYGCDNQKPRLCLSDVTVSDVTSVGADRKHTKMQIAFDSEIFEAVFFSHPVEELGIRTGDRIDISFIPHINEYKGRKKVQLLINAVRKHNPLNLCTYITETPGYDLTVTSRYTISRADCAVAWRAIKGLDCLPGTVEEVINDTPVSLEPEKFIICLLSFLDIGLLRSEDGTIFNSVPVLNSEKKDLCSSRYFA